ncbi:MAG: hypothetical protein K6U11_12200 [bacterium]|nr:hypothetical protein [bacterium]
MRSKSFYSICKINKFALILGLMILSCLLFPSPSESIGTIGVRPLTINLELAPNKKGEFTIEAYSTSPKEDASVHIYLAEVAQKEDGSVDFFDAGELPYSCTPWIKLDKTDLIVPAGEVAKIRGTVLVPAGKSGSRVAAIMVEPGYEKKPTGVSIKLRYAVVLKLNIQGRPTIEQAELKKIGIKKLADGTAGIEALIANTSEAEFKARGKISLQDSSGKIVAGFPLTTEALERKYKNEEKENKRMKKAPQQEDEDAQSIFPGARVAFFGRLDKPIPPGEYTAILNLKYGKKTLAAKQKVVLSQELASLLPKESAATSSFEIKPANLEIKGQPGGVRAGSFSIVNLTQEPIQVSLSVKDLEYSPEGETVLREKNSTPYSAADCIELEIGECTIGPRLSRGIAVKFAAPHSAEPGERYAAIVIEKKPSSAAEQEASSSSPSAQSSSTSGQNSSTSGQAEREIVEVAAIVPGQIEPAAEIVNFKHLTQSGGNLEFILEVKNSGLSHLEPKGRIMVKDIYNHDAGQIEMKLLSPLILPKTVARMRGVLGKKLSAGEYVATAEVDYGGKEAARSKITFMVK